MEPRFFVPPYGAYRSSAGAGQVASVLVVLVAVAHVVALLILTATAAGITGASLLGVSRFIIDNEFPLRLLLLYIGALGLLWWSTAVSRNFPATGSGDPITIAQLVVAWLVPIMNVALAQSVLIEIWRRTAMTQKDNDLFPVRVAMGTLVGAFATLWVAGRLTWMVREPWMLALVEFISAGLLVGSAVALVVVIRTVERRQVRRLASLVEMATALDRFEAGRAGGIEDAPPPPPLARWALAASATLAGRRQAMHGREDPADDLVVYCGQCSTPWVDDGDTCISCGSDADPVPEWELAG